MEKEGIGNKLVVVYILILVVLTVFVTFAVMTKMGADTKTESGGLGTQIGLTVLRPSQGDFGSNLKEASDGFAGGQDNER